ncbi:hypothetical protein ACKVMT_01670 [Halobacteriales archaeon Cl-PHB]
MFGDRRGLALFLASVTAFGLYWRAGVFITDNFTLTATLSALAEGRLWIEPATGDYLTAPGTFVHEGFVYGRNYGQLVLALPFLGLVEVVDAVADLRVGLVALWHLAALGLVVQLSRILNARRSTLLVGSGLTLLSFVANLALVAQFVQVSRSLLALQLSTMVAGGLLAVAVYRLVVLTAGSRVGLLAGGAAVLATPVGFWAVVPKRHVLSALLCVSILYAFARSREAPTRRPVPVLGSVPMFRAAAYALVGLLAWIHAAEGLFVLLALVAVDLPTAPTNDRQTLAVLGFTVGLSLVPFVLTNYLVAGHPLKPPRTMLTGGIDGPSLDGVTTGGGGGGGSVGSGGSGGSDLLAPLWTFVAPVLWIVAWIDQQVVGRLVAGVADFVSFESTYRTFVRSASLESLGGVATYRGVNLAMLEAAPLLAGLVVAGATVGRRLRGTLDRIRLAPTDSLAVAMSLALVLFYMPSLPVHVQVGARYLLPLYPLGLFLLVRNAGVRKLLRDRGRLSCWTYVAGVLVGVQLLVTYVVVQGLTVAEAAQDQAVLGLVLGGLLGLTLLGTSFDDRFDAPAAVSLGLAAAAGTAFVLMAGLVYFAPTGEHVLPVAEYVSDLVGLA